MLHEVFSYKNGKAVSNNSIGADCRVVWSDVYQTFYVLNHNGETVYKSTDGDGIINFSIDYSTGKRGDTCSN